MRSARKTDHRVRAARRHHNVQSYKVASKGEGCSMLTQKTAKPSAREADLNLNLEFALVAKDQRVVMAVKRPIFAAADGKDDELHIFLCDAGSATGHTLEIWSFILPMEHCDVDFVRYALDGVEVEAIRSACREASWWTDWKTNFAEVVAKDETMTPRQVADARLFLNI
jgi:hypothetical protein